MKKMILVASLLLSASVFARQNTADMTCSEAQSLVKASGAVVLSHGDQALYTRFVKNGNFCASGEKAAATYAVTLDNAKCKVGFSCVDKDHAGSVITSSEFTKCKEGSRQVFYIHDNTNDHTRMEVRTCENGRWYPKAPAPRIIKCKEGKYSSGKEYLYDRNGYFNVTRQCQSGKWVIVRATPTSDR